MACLGSEYPIWQPELIKERKTVANYSNHQFRACQVDIKINREPLPSLIHTSQIDKTLSSCLHFISEHYRMFSYKPKVSMRTWLSSGMYYALTIFRDFEWVGNCKVRTDGEGIFLLPLVPQGFSDDP